MRLPRLRRPSTPRRAAPLLALLLAAACGAEDAPPRTVDAPAAEPAAGASTVAPDTAPREAPARLALEGEGLRLFLVPSGSARPLPFGTPAEGALGTLETVLGPPTERGESPDCGAEYVVWEDAGLSVWLAGGRFVGWAARGPGSPLTTASGIGIGSTRAEIESVYAAEFPQSTLGVEFLAGGLAGLLDADGPDGRVSHLWAGQTCIAR